jgi:hypothetical protein
MVSFSSSFGALRASFHVATLLATAASQFAHHVVFAGSAK